VPAGKSIKVGFQTSVIALSSALCCSSAWRWSISASAASHRSRARQQAHSSIPSRSSRPIVSTGTTALVSEAIKERVEHLFEFRPVDRIKPKGFAAEFQVYELLGIRADDGKTGPDEAIEPAGLPAHAELGQDRH
jgi:hypothetical protein